MPDEEELGLRATAAAAVIQARLSSGRYVLAIRAVSSEVGRP
jgi:hypothetical protein